MTTWNDIIRSEQPMWNSKAPIQGVNFWEWAEKHHNRIHAKIEYATYCDKHNILGNIFVKIDFMDIMFINSYMRISNPSMNYRIDGISVPDGY